MFYVCIFTIFFLHHFSSKSIYLKEDNWGSPVFPVDQYKGKPLDELTKDCEWGWEPFSKKMESATLNLYNSTNDWMDYKGYDLVPENNESYHRFEWWNLDRKTYGSPIKGGRCNISVGDGSFWTFERIGPIRSIGNYDWWQFAWDDPFKTKEILKNNKDGFYILNYFSGAVNNNDGKTIGYPPIHIHHVHATPSPINYYRINRLKCFLGIDEHCSLTVNTLFEQHGDYQCQQKDGGTNCLLEDFPNGYARLVTSPMNINGELNDVRPPNSPTLEWYYQTAIHWTPKTEKKYYKPLSLHYIWSPGRLNIDDQSTLVNTFKTPTDKDSVMWYAGKMHFSGKLVRGKMHTHNSVFKESFFFAAHPSQLGLDDKIFLGEKAFSPVNLTNLGYKNFDELTDFLLKNYELNRKNEEPGFKKPDLICYGQTDSEKYNYTQGTFAFDRRAPTWCKEWEFKEGDYFVVVGYNGIVKDPPSLHKPGVIPPFIPGHIHWFINYESDDNISHYEYAFYSQDPQNSYHGLNVPLGSRIHMMTFLINKGIPYSSEWWFIVIGVLLCASVAVASTNNIMRGR